MTLISKFSSQIQVEMQFLEIVFRREVVLGSHVENSSLFFQKPEGNGKTKII
jgi:hypothetical protein